MGRKTGISVAAGICLTVGMLGMVPAPAVAQNFFDSLFGTQRYYDRGYHPNYRRGQYQDRYWGSRRDRYWGRHRSEGYWRQGGSYDPEALRVDSPKYYEYKPDTLANVSLAPLAQVETASADPTAVPVVKTPFMEARGFLSSASIRTFSEVGEAIISYYGNHQKFVWITNGQVNDKARAAMEALARADRFGLSPQDYLVDPPAPGGESAEATSPMQALMNFEMQLSGKVLAYVLDAMRGRVDPNRISGYHDFARKKIDLVAAMGEIAASNDIGTYLDSRHPDNTPFKALVAELAKLRASDDGQRIAIAAGTLVKPGDVDPEVPNIVNAIRARGSDALKTAYSETLVAYLGGDLYSPELVSLVRDFQKERGLKPDGIVGRATIRALTENSVQNKIDKVKLAMERLRWLPRNLGTRYVFVNQPAFQATYMEVGKTPLTMKVVVGKKSNQTFFFMDKIETVEFNPYWGVPLSIIVNEMLPKLNQDPYYLDRIGYEVTTANGEQVSSAQVNWYAVARKQATINVRQPPGGDNALGELKILFPNAHAIYMHDTPARELFLKQERAFSHGCIRLEKPREMAAAVLGKSVDYIASRVAQGQNDKDTVTTDIPVYVSYFTAWPDAGGAVHYYEDMYERDMYLKRAVERTELTRQAEA